MPEFAPLISLRGCRQHHLKQIDVEIPLGKLTVITGPSGSGKSSLAFHTLYAEGQRRYVETFSPYVRQFFERMDKPAVDVVDGIPPAIAIEQKNFVRTTRSTVGTLTEIHDYLKLFFARLAVAHDPATDEIIRPDTAESVQKSLLGECAEQAVTVTFAIVVPAAFVLTELVSFLQAQGYIRLWLKNKSVRLDEMTESDVADIGNQVWIVQDRLKITAENSGRLLEALEAGFRYGRGEIMLRFDSDVRAYSVLWKNPSTGFTVSPPSPALFSFNSPLGACQKCRGFGRVIGIDLDKAIPDKSLSIEQGAIKPFGSESGEICQKDLIKAAKKRGLNLKQPFEDLSAEERDWVYYGENSNSSKTAEEIENIWDSEQWYGVQGYFDWLESKSYKMPIRVLLSRYRSHTTCSSCRGRRLRESSLCFKVNRQNVADLCAMPVSELLAWFKEQQAAQFQPTKFDSALDLVFSELISRLSYLAQVGLGYLTLDRQARTLSGGEVARVNLTACLGAALTGTLFVLDEPTVGLHPRDVQRLIGVMQQLRNKGNTIVVVEHEAAMMRAADHLIDLGPGAGKQGGELMYAGELDLKSPISVGTLPWLRGEKSIPIPKNRRKVNSEKLTLRGASKHNINKLDVSIPLNRFVCLTGVSGSGKSTLVRDVIYLNVAKALGQEIEDEAVALKSISGTESLSSVEWIDQTPLARTPRSTPAVMIGAFQIIRQLFAATEEAKNRECSIGFFSFNSGEGRCDRCSGNGFEKVEMQFLSDIYVTCPMCNGSRYKTSTLALRYREKSIADVLAMTVDEARCFFSSDETSISALEKKRYTQMLAMFKPLQDVGLGYLALGQALNTLSGGESQRLKLCQLLQEVGKKSQEHKLIILDEPTTGLHVSDIQTLLQVFQKLVDAGHSLIVVEHNLEVIKVADWIIDLGPEAGTEGGKIVAEGSPETVAKAKSPTAQFLRHILAGKNELEITEDEEITTPEADKGVITIRGARHHNLKNISLDIPRDQFVVISGLSGSGKSTLAFDLLFAEGQRRFLDSMSAYARQFAEQLEKPEVDQIAGLPPTVAIEQRVSQGSGKSTVATVTEVWNFVRLLYSKLGTLHCPACHIPVEKQSMSSMEAILFQRIKKGKVRLLAPMIRGKKGFHTDVAEWAAKQGFTTLLVDGKWQASASFEKLERFKEHDIDAVVAELSSSNTSELPRLLEKTLEMGKGVIRIADEKDQFELLSLHANCPSCQRSFEALDPRMFSFNSPHGWCESCRGHGRVPKQKRAMDLSKFESVLEAELDADRAQARLGNDDLHICPTCDGSRLNALARSVSLQGTTLSQLSERSIEAATRHFEQLSFEGERESMIARDILPEIRQRLAFLEKVGLGYLTLQRSATTLSGGESQRIRLAAQLGSNLRGVLYVLDEPTIGLHPRDNAALLKTLMYLKEQGNSVIVVEHDEDTIAAADHVIDLGPGAGKLGGEIVYQGTAPNTKTPLSDLSESLLLSPTYRAFAANPKHPLRGQRRKVTKKSPSITLSGCSANHLKKVKVSIPLGRLTVLTGVSGSGKSSLMRQCIAEVFSENSHKNFEKVSGEKEIQACYEVDQSPIGKTSRSCPATYVKIFDDIRALFAQLPEARMRGYDASRFSFNTDGGRCPECKGNGRIKLEMDFLPSTWVHCDCCDGQRYHHSTLEIRFHGKHIGEILQMTMDEAARFFMAQTRIARPLQLLADTGLGYLQLGQASSTLSGGEAQRIKLVSELIKGRGNLKSSKANLYLIEEPTVGLHREDVGRLIEVLHRLVDEGHTVVVIEHHMAVAAEADWLIDLGPEAGEKGGEIVAEGTPEKVAQSKDSRTAPFLKPMLSVES